ncbi:MAG TPA: hypothetical protein VHY08_13465 [Bacillota bacterium]|nr:hypothetical protein [Bacillota bacterium]
MPGSAINTISMMRNVIRNLQQTESQNANLAGNWAQAEVKQAAALNNNTGSVPEMASHSNQLAGILQQFHNTANHAAFQLGNLEHMLDELEHQIH